MAGPGNKEILCSILTFFGTLYYAHYTMLDETALKWLLAVLLCAITFCYFAPMRRRSESETTGKHHPSSPEAVASYEQFVREKNSNAGPSVFARTPRAVWSTNAGQIPAAERLPRVPTELPAFILRGVISPAESQAIIECLPEMRNGPGYMPPAQVRRRYRDRVVHRYLVDDQALAEVIGDRLAPYLPQQLDGGLFCGLSPLWRILHYEMGGRQGVHVDGREPAVAEKQQPVLGSASTSTPVWIQSRLTVQIYLNGQDDFTGGQLSFFDSDAQTKLHSIEPAVGDCVVFYQEEISPYHLLHEGGAVLSGNKYTIRTMANYAFCSRQAAAATLAGGGARPPPSVTPSSAET